MPSVAYEPDAVTTSDMYPLSALQQGLWFLEQLTPGTTANHVPMAVSIEGPLVAQHLERALRRVLERHAGTRVVILASGKEPMQRPQPLDAFSLPLVSLLDVPASEIDGRVREIVAEQASRPFDLARGPLWRFTLVRVSTERHVLAATWHHLIFDGWSHGVFVAELRAAYDAAESGRTELAPLPVQYAEFVKSSSAQLQGAPLETLRRYWRGALGDAPGRLDLPADRPRPTARTDHSAGQVGFVLDRATTSALKQLGQKRGATLFMTLLAVFKALLCRYSGQMDVCVGTPFACRSDRAHQQLIGMFVNMLALRTRVVPEQSFLDLLERVRAGALGAYKHGDLPFSSVVDTLQIDRDGTRHPLFQVFFALQQGATLPAETTRVRMRLLEADGAGIQYDLAFHLFETADAGVRGSMRFRADLYDVESVHRLLRYFERLARQVAAAPEVALSAHELIDDGELQRAAVRGRASSSQQALAPLDQAVAQRAVETPSRLAVNGVGTQLSYADLARAVEVLRHNPCAGAGALRSVALAVAQDVLRAPAEPFARRRAAWLAELLGSRKNGVLLRKSTRDLDTLGALDVTPLSWGGTLAISEARDLEGWWTDLCALQVTVAFITAEDLERIVSSSSDAWRGRSSLELVICVGRPLRQAWVDELVRRVGCELVAVQSAPQGGELTMVQCRQGAGRDMVPLGAPAYRALRVVDAAGRLVPDGVVGALEVAESDDATGTAWRATGVRARYDSLGVLEPMCEDEFGFSSQRSVQRGWLWVDLARIEDVLREHSDVLDAFVVARRGAHASEIVAYVVPRQDLEESVLAGHVVTRLSVEHRPQHFCLLSRLPLRADGIVDVAKLASVPVVGREQLAMIEQRVRSLPGTRDVVAVTARTTGSSERIHLADVLPSVRTKVVSNERSEPMASAPRPTVVDRPLALSDGGPVPDDVAGVTLVHLLLAARGAESALTFVGTDAEERRFSYGLFAQSAHEVLAGLQHRRLSPGDRVILLLSDAEALVRALWACLLGGYVPLVLTPSSEKDGGGWPDVAATWELMGHPPIIVDGATHAAQLSDQARSHGAAGASVLSFDSLRVQGAKGATHIPNPGDLAILFRTSGSTGVPKIVQLTHRNIVASMRSSARALGLTPSDVCLNWMALDHPGPLIRCVLRNIMLGCAQVHVESSAILRQPTLWLDLLERYRVTNTWAPNFAFGLVNQHADEIGARRWSLSSLRSVLNTAEPISLRTARRFLELLEPSGLSAEALHASWGMAETSSGVTLSTSFLRPFPDSGAETMLVDLGPPTVGVALRVVDDDNHVVPEGTIGHLHVRGATVTAGYLGNSSDTAAAFTPDGWFITGDLATLEGGRLRISGRYKDAIITHGSKLHPADLEAVVGEVDGVDTSFVAAFGFRKPSEEADRIAVLFASRAGESAPPLSTLLERIRRTVSGRFGVGIDVAAAVPREAIAKTSLGKVQRQLLRRRYLAGDFDEAVRRADVASRASNTMPNWSFRVKWRRKQLSATAVPSSLPLRVVFMDDDGLGAALASTHENHGGRCIRVRRASGYGQKAGEWQLDVDEASHYDRLFKELDSEPGALQVIHALAYRREAGGDASRALRDSLASVLMSVCAMHRCGVMQRSQLVVVGCGSQVVTAEDRVVVDRSGTTALIRTALQEMPELRARCVDLDGADPVADASTLDRELLANPREPEVAYRAGARFVPRLENEEAPSPHRREPWKQGGRYVVAGGLGGLGSVVARHLLEHYDCRVLVLGRSSVEGDAARGETLSQLRQLGHVVYERVDVRDAGALQACVDEACRRWEGALDGVINASGEQRHCLLVDEEPQAIVSLCLDRIAANLNLHAVAKKHGATSFVTFSSVNGFFGGVSVGAYAAACRWLDTWAESLSRERKPAVYCCAWSRWDGIGMSRKNDLRIAALARGFHTISQEQGVGSLHHVLGATRGTVLVGLEHGNPHIRPWVLHGPVAYGAPRLFVAPATQDDGARRSADLASFTDAFGTRVAIDVKEVDEIARRADGHVDVDRLTRDAEQTSRVVPRTELERSLAELWTSVLRQEDIGVTDNFFALGGDSVGVIQLAARAKRLGLRLTARDVFEHQTVAELAAALERPARTHATEIERVRVAPLTPVQERFFAQPRHHPAFYNVWCLFDASDVALDPLQLAVREVMRHHDILRARFRHGPHGLQQELASDAPDDPVQVVALEAADALQEERSVDACIQQANRSLDLHHGPLVRFVLFRSSSGNADRLLVLMHHLLCDQMTWQILLDDIRTAYTHAVAGRTISLPDGSAPFLTWAAKLRALAGTPWAEGEARAWVARIDAVRSPPAASTASVENVVGGARTLEAHLSVAETSALLEGVRDARVRGGAVQAAVLGALALTLARHSESTTVAIDLSAHGREDELLGLDISRTIGYFTTIYPLLVDIDPAAGVDDAVAVVTRYLATVHNSGIGFGLSRYAGASDEVRAKLRALAPRVGFHYLGTQSRASVPMLAPVRRPPWTEQDAAEPRLYELDVAVSVIGEELVVRWNCGTSFPHDARQLLDELTEHLRCIRGRS